MKRKVIKQANQAYTITLPIFCVRQNSITSKTELDVEIANKSLIITSPNSVKSSSKTFDSESLTTREIQLRINAYYAQGVDELKIISKTDISSMLIKSLNQNPGFALISQLNNLYTIKDISGTSDTNLDEIFKRVFQVTLSFYDAAIKDIFGEEQESLEGLRFRDGEVNKFTLYLQRAINRKMYRGSINGRILFTYSYALEKIGDEVARLWKTNIKCGIKKNKTIKEITALTQDCLLAAFTSYYNPTPKNLDLVFTLRNKIRKLSLKLLKLDSITARFIRHVVKISEDCADLIHLILMRTN